MIEKEVEVGSNMDAWMDKVTGSKALPGGKGIVATIHAPEMIKTSFGDRQKCQVIINGSDGSTINVGLFLPQNFPMLHPKSNLAKILAFYECPTMKDLIGKEVMVDEASEGIWKIRMQ